MPIPPASPDEHGLGAYWARILLGTKRSGASCCESTDSAPPAGRSHGANSYRMRLLTDGCAPLSRTGSWPLICMQTAASAEESRPTMRLVLTVHLGRATRGPAPRSTPAIVRRASPKRSGRAVCPRLPR
jgi:hypothetical protein